MDPIPPALLPKQGLLDVFGPLPRQNQSRRQEVGGAERFELQRERQIVSVFINVFQGNVLKLLGIKLPYPGTKEKFPAMPSPRQFLKKPRGIFGPADRPARRFASEIQGVKTVLPRTHNLQVRFPQPIIESEDPSDREKHNREGRIVKKEPKGKDEPNSKNSQDPRGSRNNQKRPEHQPEKAEGETHNSPKAQKITEQRSEKKPDHHRRRRNLIQINNPAPDRSGKSADALHKPEVREIKKSLNQIGSFRHRSIHLT